MVSPLKSLRQRLKNVRDPSQANKLGLAYARNLDKLFQAYKRDIRKVLGVREFEDPNPNATKLVDLQLRHTVEVTISIPGKPIAKTGVDKAYATGALKASQFVSALGYDVTYSRTPTDTKVIDILEQRNFSALKGITDDMSKSITRVLTDDVLDGKGPYDIAKDLDAEVDIGRDRALLMARTETMTAFNRSALVQYDKYGVTQVEWYTSHLENVCDECDALDGKRFESDDAPVPPLHPNCPCILLPVIDIEAFKEVRT